MAMNKTVKYLFSNVENVIGAVLIFLMIVFLSVQVISRYVFHSPITWTEELAKMAFILSVFWGSVGAWHRNQHLALGIITERLSPKSRCYFRIVSDILTLLFCVAIFPAMCTLVANNYNSGMKLPVTQWPKWIFYLFMPITFALLSYRIIEELFAIVRAIKNGSYDFLRPEAKRDLETEEVSLDSATSGREAS